MKKALFIVFFLTAAAFGQASRFDNAAQTTLAGGVVITSPLAVVTACNFPATVIAGQACTNKASICTGIAGSCSTTGNPVTADSQGNFGFWLLPGAYDYTVCPVGGTCSSPVHLVISPTTASNVTWTGTHNFSVPPVFASSLGISSGGTNNTTFSFNGAIYFDGTRLNSTGTPPSSGLYCPTVFNGVWALTNCAGTSSTSWGLLSNAVQNLILNNGAFTTTINGTGALTYGGSFAPSTGLGDGTNTFIGTSSGSSIIGGAVRNISLGYQALQHLTSGNSNIAIGWEALLQNTTAINNIAIGAFAMGNTTTGGGNIAIGETALAQNITGVQNIAIGGLSGATGPGGNIVIGGGNSYTTTESGNILIGSDGVIADINTIRLGTPGTQTQTFLSGKVTLDTSAFASLGTPVNGTIIFCNNCTIANPCAGGGTGALAKRLNGAWVCN